MVLHDIRDLKDIQRIRLTRPNQAEKVLVRLTMLIIAARYGDQPSLDLTDFTSGYRSNILNFTVKTGSLASQHFKELKKAYPIVDKSTKNALSGTKNKVNFLENGYQVFLNVIAEAYNGVTEYQLKITEFKIINKQPQMILRMSLTQQAKITALVKLMEKRRENNDIKTPENEDEIKKIIGVIRRDHPEDHPSKKLKPNEPETSKSQSEPSQPSSNSIVFPSNPLFNPAIDNQEDEIPFTQMQNEILPGSDDLADIVSDGAQESVYQSQPEGDRIQNEQYKLPQIKEEPNEKIHVKPEPGIDSRMKLLPTNTTLSQQLRDNNIDVITVLNDSDDDYYSSDTDEIKNTLNQTKDKSNREEVRTPLTPTVRDSSAQPQHQEHTVQLEQKEHQTHQTKSTRSTEGGPKPTSEPSLEKNEDEPQGSTESEDSNYADRQNGIETIMKNPIELDLPYQFTGYVIGIEPSNFKVMAKPFGDLIKTTNFKLYISNVPQVDSNIFKVNKNVLCLEFRTKEQILSFFGYDDIEVAYDEQDQIQKKLKKLLQTSNRIELEIVRKQINLSVGKQYIWESNNSIDEIIK